MYGQIMKKYLYSSLLILAVIGTLLYTVDNTDSVISPDTVSSFVAIGITKLSVEFKGVDIILKATTNTDMTCEDLIERLAINDVVFDNNTYSPVCSRRGTTITVTYKRHK